MTYRACCPFLCQRSVLQELQGAQKKPIPPATAGSLGAKGRIEAAVTVPAPTSPLIEKVRFAQDALVEAASGRVLP
jgi:hypothetical protein